MPERIVLYYITDRSAFPGDAASQYRHLLNKIAEAVVAGVDYIQLREKDLSARHLEALAHQAMEIIAETPGSRTALLINSRTDVAFAVSAAGVHLTGSDPSPAEVFSLWNQFPLAASHPLISVSCHSPEEVFAAAASFASLAIFAPVFKKNNAPGIIACGLDALQQACHAPVPVLALGGITLENAERCLQAGAAGIAAIRLFQESELATIVNRLRGPHVRF